MTKAEDPEKILEQAVIDMQGDLIKMRQASAQVLMPIHAGVVKGLIKGLPVPSRMMNSVLIPALCFLQVVASQKQLELKYKQAQQTAVSIRSTSK